jgi:hypothetical protein
MTAIPAALQHAFTVLDGLSCPVYTGVAPEHATYPCVVIQPYGDAYDTTALHGQRVKTEVDLMVRAVLPGADVAGAADLVEDIDAALHNSGPATYTAGDVNAVIRQREVMEMQVLGGKPWTYAGGVYRVYVSA